MMRVVLFVGILYWCCCHWRQCAAIPMCTLQAEIDQSQTSLSYVINVTSPPAFVVSGQHVISAIGHLYVAPSSSAAGSCPTTALEWAAGPSFNIVLPACRNFAARFVPSHIFNDVAKMTAGRVNGHVSMNNIEVSLYGTALLRGTQANSFIRVYFQTGGVIIAVPGQVNGLQLMDFSTFVTELTSNATFIVSDDLQSAVITIPNMIFNTQFNAGPTGVAVNITIAGRLVAKALFARDVMLMEGALFPNVSRQGLTAITVNEQEITSIEHAPPSPENCTAPVGSPGPPVGPIVAGTLSSVAFVLIIAGLAYCLRNPLKTIYRKHSGSLVSSRSSREISAIIKLDDLKIWRKVSRSSADHSQGILHSQPRNNRHLGGRGCTIFTELKLSEENLQSISALERSSYSLKVQIELLQNQSESLPVSDFSSLTRQGTPSDIPHLELVRADEKVLRLWLMPIFDVSNSENQSHHSHVFPLRTTEGLPPANVDLGLNIFSDLQFPLNSMLGVGASGDVHRAIFKDGRPVAVKRLLGEHTLDAVQAFRKEVEIMSVVDHPNILRCLGGCLSPPHVFIMMELMECSLHDIIHRWLPQKESPLSLVSLFNIAKDIASGLRRLHQTRVVHRDLKPRNVLIDRKGTAKLGDFGISKIQEHTFLTSRNLDFGTVPYMAPESFTRSGVTEKCDIYSFGIILHECFTRLRPWQECQDPFVIAYQVSQGNRPPFPPKPAVPRGLRQLIELCWHANPLKRPSIDYILDELNKLTYQLSGTG